MPFPEVSKFHGYFQVDGAKLSYVDAGSRNGTTIRNVPLPSRKTIPIELRAGTGLDVGFGLIRGRIYLPADFWHLLQVMKQAARKPS
jgi:hypothetical protein